MNAVDQSAVARVLGIKTSFINLRGDNVVFLPQRLAVIGQGNEGVVYSNVKKQYTSALDVANAYGFGSPLHLAAKQIFPDNGDGVGSIPVTFYPMSAHASGTVSSGTIGFTGTATENGTIYVLINNIRSLPITINTGDVGTDLEDAITTAINGVLDMPVTAVANGVDNDSDLTSKWKGVSANDIKIESSGTVAGITVVITAMSGGTNNPLVDGMLSQVGEVWETMILNCLDIADTAALDEFSTFGEGRWGSLTRKPCVVFTGNNATTVASSTTVSDARKTDRTNVQLVSPGSSDLPFVIAARQLARIVKLANNNPAHDYGSQKATGLTPGADGDQWDYAERDQAVKAGSSTIEVRDGVVNISDVVTFYHPTGDVNPAYRYVVDIVKLQNVIFNLDLEFAREEWDGAPLIPDDQPTVNRSAKKPKSAKAAIASIIDGLGNQAIISDPKTAKSNTVVQINDSNPKRLDMVVPVQVSGNTNIKSVDLNFGFFFG